MKIPSLRVRGTLLEECRDRSLELLRGNSTPQGLLACSPSARAAGRNYTSIFGRDAAISALGMFACGEPDLVGTARAGLLTLARHQAGNGQIPKFVRPETGESDFWYAGCIDATLWWLIAVHFHDRLVPGGALREELKPQVDKALQWLHCQEHPVWHLLQQNEASDWADIMPRSGFVLYTNALWHWVQNLYGVAGAGQTRELGNALFSPFDTPAAPHRRVELMRDYIRQQARPSEFYLSFVNFSFWGEEIDVFGNLLAALTGLAARPKAERLTETILSLDISRPWPIRVVGHPIEQGTPLWRPYMARHEQNHPYQYHNGGIWPFVGGFWVMLLAGLGCQKEAWEELERLAAVNQAGGWEFNEWFHGRTGAAMGMAGQSWNAALFVLAFTVLSEKLPVFESPSPSF